MAVVALLSVPLLGGCSSTADTGDASTAATSVTAADVGDSTTSAPNTTTTLAPSTTTATTTPPTTSAGAAVDRLVVRPTDDGGAPPYRRAAFGDDWAYDPSSGCNTRERVLIEESIIPPKVDDRCRTTNGRWRSSYDGVVTDDPADLQIDHVVALANAWRSGAWRWTAERRFSFANDLTEPETLAAVTGHSNQSKGDSSPDQWLPDDRSQWCPFATTWVAIKRRWQLTVTPSEKATLVAILNGC